MTRNRKRRARRVIRVYKLTIVSKGGVLEMEKEKKKFPWFEVIKAVVMAVLGVLTGTQL